MHKELLSKYQLQIREIITCSISGLYKMAHNDNAMVCGSVDKLKILTTKIGDHMAFAHIIDLSGSIEAILFPEVYEKFCRLKTTLPMFFTGKLNKGDDCEPPISLLVDDVFSFRDLVKR